MRKDYLEDSRNAGSGPTSPLPICRLIGTDGSVFAIIGRVQRALREAGQPERAAAFVERAFKARSYDEVLQLCRELVEVL